MIVYIPVGGIGVKMLDKGIVIVANAGDDNIIAYCSGTYREVFRVRPIPYDTKTAGPIGIAGDGALLGPVFLYHEKAKNQLLVVNSYDDSLSIIDLTSREAIKTIFVGCCPSRLVVLNENNRAFITNYDSDSISVIDLSAEQLIGQIPCGAMPKTIIFNEYNGMCYVANTGSNYIAVIDISCMDKADCLDANGYPMDICFDDTGQNLYAIVLPSGGEGDSRLVEYDIKSGKNIRCTEFCAMPVDLVYDNKRGKFYILDIMDNRLIIVDRSDFFVSGAIKLGNMPVSQSLDSNGKYLHVVCNADNQLCKVDLKAGSIKSITRTGIEPAWLLCID